MSRPIPIVDQKDVNGQRNEGLPPNHPQRRVFAELQNITAVNAHPPRATTPMPADDRASGAHVSFRAYIERIIEESGFRLLVAVNIVYSMIRFVCGSYNNTSMSCEHARVIQYEVWMRCLDACNPLAPVADRLAIPENSSREAGPDYSHGRYVEASTINFVGEPVSPTMLINSIEDIRAEAGFYGLISLQNKQRILCILA